MEQRMNVKTHRARIGVKIDRTTKCEPVKIMILKHEQITIHDLD